MRVLLRVFLLVVRLLLEVEVEVPPELEFPLYAGVLPVLVVEILPVARILPVLVGEIPTVEELRPVVEIPLKAMIPRGILPVLRVQPVVANLPVLEIRPLLGVLPR